MFVDIHQDFIAAGALVAVPNRILGERNPVERLLRQSIATMAKGFRIPEPAANRYHYPGFALDIRRRPKVVARRVHSHLNVIAVSVFV